jgi:integrase
MGKGWFMARALFRLTAMKVAKAKRPGLYADGGSLYLRVAEGGSKQWIFRYVTNGRMRDMGIGPAHTLTLAEARERATEARKLRLDGIDPIVHKRARVAAIRAADDNAMTFRQCADGFVKDHSSTWSNTRHRADWESSLLRHVYPSLGALPISSIDTPLVLRTLKPIWTTIPETATRVRQRIESIIDWATAHHFRTGDNPARWGGRLEHALPARAKIAAVKHHVALPMEEVGAVMNRLRAEEGTAARCLEFIMLTAARLSEALGAEWREIDFAARTWTVPANRMKSRRTHKVPLSDAAVAVLEQMNAVRCSDYVFPGNREGRPIGDNSVWRLVKDVAGDKQTTVHGLRSCFKDWCSERTNFAREVSEMALAHAIPDAVEAAYRRGDLFEKRRKLMDAWAAHCAKIETDPDNLIALAGARTPR